MTARRVGKAERAHQPTSVDMVGTAQARLCPPYGFEFQTATASRSRRRFSREVCSSSPAPSLQRAQGMPGARCARSLACSKKQSIRVSHHEYTGTTRHSPRNGFNGFLRTLPGDRACLSPSPRRNNPARLGAGVEASGPHDFAVRNKHARQVRAVASTASRPAFRDVAQRPSVGWDGRDIRLICVSAKQKYFDKRGLTTVCTNG